MNSVTFFIVQKFDKDHLVASPASYEIASARCAFPSWTHTFFLHARICLASMLPRDLRFRPCMGIDVDSMVVN